MRDYGMSAKGISTVLAGLRLEQREQWRIFEKGSQLNQAIGAAAEDRPFELAIFENAVNRFDEIRLQLLLALMILRLGFCALYRQRINRSSRGWGTAQSMPGSDFLPTRSEAVTKPPQMTAIHQPRTFGKHRIRCPTAP